MEFLLVLLGALPWQQIVGFLINTVGVMLVMYLLKKYKPQLRRYIPMLAPLVAVALPALAIWLTAMLGIPIDFSLILGFFSGFSAIGVHQIVRQKAKRKKERILMKTPSIEVRQG